MNSETCQIVAGVLSVLLLALVVERRNISPKITTTKWFRNIFLATFTLMLVGLAYSIIGIQTKGLFDLAGAILWGICAIAFTLFALVLLMQIATAEVAEETALSRELKKTKSGKRRK